MNMGNMTMSEDAVMLKGATVTGQAKKVVVKKDTFVYNSSAFRTPEGSAIEELVKRLPGAEIDESGKITINGKEVKKIKVDGKEFMTGDTKTALKNLPTSIVDKIKAYDEKSDLARVTGIDDGNESTVLDFGIKRGMNKGMFSNADVSVGTEPLLGTPHGCRDAEQHQGHDLRKRQQRGRQRISRWRRTRQLRTRKQRTERVEDARCQLQL